MEEQFPFELQENPKKVSKFMDYKSGSEVELDAEEGGFNSQIQDSGVGLSPDKIYNLISPDGESVHLKGSDPAAVDKLKNGFKIQAGGFVDDFEDAGDQLVQNGNIETSVWKAASNGFFSGVGQGSLEAYSTYLGDKSFVRQRKEDQQEHFKSSLTGEIAGEIAFLIGAAKTGALVGGAAGSILPGAGTGIGAVAGGVTGAALAGLKLVRGAKILKNGAKLVKATKKGQLVYSGLKATALSAKINAPFAFKQELIDGYDETTGETTISPGRLATSMAIGTFLPFGLKYGIKYGAKGVGAAGGVALRPLKKVTDHLSKNAVYKALNISDDQKAFEFAKRLKENKFFRNQLQKAGVKITDETDDFTILKNYGRLLRDKGIIGGKSTTGTAVDEAIKKNQDELLQLVKGLKDKGIKISRKQINNFIKKIGDGSYVGADDLDSALFDKPGFNEFRKFIHEVQRTGGVGKVQTQIKTLKSSVSGKLDDLSKSDKALYKELSEILGYKGKGIFQEAKSVLTEGALITKKKLSGVKSELKRTLDPLKEEVALIDKTQKRLKEYAKQGVSKDSKKYIKAKGLIDSFTPEEIAQRRKLLKDLSSVSDELSQFNKIASKAEQDIDANAFFRQAMDFVEKNVDGKTSSEAAKFMDDFFSQMDDLILGKVKGKVKGKGIKDIVQEGEFLHRTKGLLKGQNMNEKFDLLPNAYFLMATFASSLGGIAPVATIAYVGAEKALNRTGFFGKHAIGRFEKNINNPKNVIKLKKPSTGFKAKTIDAAKAGYRPKELAGAAFAKTWTEEKGSYEEYLNSLYDNTNGKGVDRMVSAKTLEDSTNGMDETLGVEVADGISTAGIYKALEIQQALLDDAPKMNYNSITGEMTKPHKNELLMHSRLSEMALDPSKAYDYINNGTISQKETDFLKNQMPDLYEKMSEKLQEFYESDRSKMQLKQIRSIELFLGGDSGGGGDALTGNVNNPYGAIEDVSSFSTQGQGINYKPPKHKLEQSSSFRGRANKGVSGDF